MPGEEGETFGFVAQQHGREVAVPEADLSVFRHGTGNAEGLKADADGFGGFGSRGAAFPDGDGRADGIGPAGVFKGDGLNFLHDAVRIDAPGGADVPRLFQGGDAVFLENRIDAFDAAFVTFKQCHDFPLPYSFLGSIYFTASANCP